MPHLCIEQEVIGALRQLISNSLGFMKGLLQKLIIAGHTQLQQGSVHRRRRDNRQHQHKHQGEYQYSPMTCLNRGFRMALHGSAILT